MQINTYKIKLLSKQTESMLNNLISCQTQFTVQLKHSKSTHEASYSITLVLLPKAHQSVSVVVMYKSLPK